MNKKPITLLLDEIEYERLQKVKAKREKNAFSVVYIQALLREAVHKFLNSEDK